jgi:protein-tyrosine phosphatase
MTGHGLTPTQLTPWLWLGRYKDATNNKWMRDHGITHVVNCLDKDAAPNDDIMAELDMYVYLKSHDSVTYPLFHDSKNNSVPGDATNWEIVEKVLGDAKRKHDSGQHAGVLIYCMAGLNRSATLAAAFLAVHCGFSIQEVATLIRRMRPGALSNRNFVKQLAHVLHKDCLT